MTFAQARAACRRWQCRLGKSQHGEYIVTPLWDDREETRYYTNDLDDAVGSAHAMWERQDILLHMEKKLVAAGTPTHMIQSIMEAQYRRIK